MDNRIRMTSDEAARYLRISYGFLMKLTRENSIPHYRLGVKAFYFQDSLDLWLHNLETATTQSQITERR